MQLFLSLLVLPLEFQSSVLILLRFCFTLPCLLYRFFLNRICKDEIILGKSRIQFELYMVDFLSESVVEPSAIKLRIESKARVFLIFRQLIFCKIDIKTISVLFHGLYALRTGRIVDLIFLISLCINLREKFVFIVEIFAAG